MTGSQTGIVGTTIIDEPGGSGKRPKIRAWLRHSKGTPLEVDEGIMPGERVVSSPVMVGDGRTNSLVQGEHPAVQ